MPDASLDEQRKANPPLWAGNKGIFADLSDYPRSTSFYVKCPDCGHVHGDFTTMRQAFDHRTCPACHFDQIEKIKKEAATAHLPEKPKKRGTHESMAASSLVRRLLGEDEDDDIAGDVFDQMGSKEHMLSSTQRGLNWVLDAMEDLEKTISGGWELGRDFEDATENPDDYTKIELTNGSQEWVVYKDLEDAEAAALAKVTEDLTEYPENFTKSWLSSFINIEKLRREIGDPYADHEEETYGNMDYGERLQTLEDEGKIEGDDPRFFGEIVDPDDPENPDWGALEETPERANLINDLITELAEENRPKFEPISWLKDIYGEDEYMAEVGKMNAIDIPRAAEAAIRDDGWDHFMSSYDDGHTELGGNAVAIRMQ